MQPHYAVSRVVAWKRATHNLSSVLKKWAPRSSKQSVLLCSISLASPDLTHARAYLDTPAGEDTKNHPVPAAAGAMDIFDLLPKSRIGTDACG